MDLNSPEPLASRHMDQHQLISDIFLVPLHSQSHQPESSESRFSVDVLDQILTEKLFAWDSDQSILQYLFDVFVRIDTTWNNRPDDHETLSKCRDLTLKYSGLILQLPEMFPQNPDIQAQGPLVLMDIQKKCEESGQKNLFVKFVQAILDTEIEDLDKAFLTVINQYQARLRSMKIDNDEIFGVLDRLAVLVGIRQISNIVVKDARRMMELNGFLLEKGVFGRLFGIDKSVVQSFLGTRRSGTLETYIRGVRDRRELGSIWETFRRRMDMIHRKLCDMIVGMIRHTRDNATGENPVVDWFEDVVRGNESWGKMMMTLESRMESSSLGFLFHWGCVVLRMCIPFLKQKESKYHLVNMDYFDLFSKKESLSQVHFVGRMYCIGLYMDRICISRMIQRYIEFLGRLEQIHEREGLGQHRDLVDMKHEMELVLFDENLIGMVRDMWIFTFGLIGKICRDKEQIRKMPEFVFVNGIDFYLFANRVLKRLSVLDMDFYPREMLDLTLVVLETEYVNVMYRLGCVDTESKPFLNPYTTFKLIELLYQTIDVHQQNLDILGVSSILPKLIPYLVGFFVRVEKLDKTETSDGFYDKFHMRWTVLSILRVTDIVEMDKNLMVKMIYLLLNDFTYLLEESLIKLNLVHEEEIKGAGEDVFERCGGRQIKIMLTLFDGYLWGLVKLLRNKLLTKVFLTEEIGDRLTAITNYHLKKLIGSRQSGSAYRVTNPARYGFHPKSILNGLAVVIASLSRHVRFQKSVLKDKRSFSFSLYTGLILRIKKYQIGDLETLEKLEALVESLGKIVAEDKTAKEYEEDDEDIEDLPEEFCDPLMATLMRDPVVLKTSGVTVDRSTITRLFLDDASDPFNRKPLTMADIVPNTDLKARIEEFLKSRQRQKGVDLLDD